MKSSILIDTYNLLSEDMQKLAFDYITFLAIRENKIVNNEKLIEIEDEINPELKEFLNSRILKYQNNPENSVTWNEVKNKFNKKHNYAI